MPVIDLKKIRTENHWTNKLKDGAKRVGRAVKEKVHEGVEFVKENPQTAATLLAIGGAALGGARKVMKGIVKHVNLKQEKYNKERYIYDHSLGMFLKTKQPLTEKDYRNIEALRKKGYRKSEALIKLGLLVK